MRARGTMDFNEDEEIKPLVYKVAAPVEPMTPEQKVSQLMQDLSRVSKMTAVCVLILLVSFLVQWIVFQNNLDEIYDALQTPCNCAGSYTEIVHSNSDTAAAMQKTEAALQKTEAALRKLSGFVDALHQQVPEKVAHISTADARPTAATLPDNCLLQQLPAWVDNVTQTLGKVLAAATHTDTSLHTGRLRITLD